MTRNRRPKTPLKFILYLAFIFQTNKCWCTSANTERSSSIKRNDHNKTEVKTSSVKTRNLIVGGDEVRLGKYPFFGFWKDAKCGCTFIHSDMFLTAAHCVNLTSAEALGHIRLHTQGDPAIFEIKQIYVHPKFQDHKWDFAILKVAEPVPKTLAYPVPLNLDINFLTTLQETAYLTAVGFGAATEISEQFSTTLQEVTMPYIPNFPTCSRAYGNSIIDAELCAGNLYEGGQDACTGDSGGPLLWNSDYNLFADRPNQANPLVLVGVVSYGRGCGRASQPGVYSRVSSAIDWIYKVICLQSNQPPLQQDGICNTTIMRDDTISLRVQISYTHALGIFSWGLYHIDSATTIYDSQQADEEKNRERKKRTLRVESKSEDLKFPDLPPGKYLFQFRDPSRDNLNTVKIFEGGVVPKVWVDLQGVSKSFYHKYFTIQNRSSMSLSEVRIRMDNGLVEGLKGTSPSERRDKVQLTIQIQYDDASAETSWMLTKRRDNPFRNIISREIIFYSSRLSVEGSQLITMTFEIPASGGIYDFKMWDAHKDGICCSKGNGWIAILVGKEVVYVSDGNFSSKLSTTIEI